MKKTNIKNTAIFAAAFFALIFCACKNMYKGAEQKQTGILKAKIALPDTYEAFQSTARSALPSGFGNALVFAGAVTQYGNPASADLQIGTFNSSDNTLELPFLSSSKKRADYKLDIYAFVNTDDVSDIDKAILHGQTSISILAYAGSADISGEIKMRSFTNSSGVKGSVDLKISIPTGYTLSAECKTHPGETISATKDEANSNDEIWLYKITGELAAGAHNVNFFVKKSDVVIYAWNEALNVIPGLVTNKWVSSNVDANGVRKIEKIENTFYVRGEPASGQRSWFADFATAYASDSNNGSIAAPFATVQKAIDVIVGTNTTQGLNTGAEGEAYTIYVDGVLKNSGGSGQVVNIDNPTHALKLLIKGIGSNQAVLDGNLSSPQTDGTVIYIKDTNGLDLTLENLKITGGNTTSYGGGIYYLNGDNASLTLKNCEISGNNAQYGGRAIYNDGVLKLSGAVQISSSGSDVNDIFLEDGKIIEIAKELTGTAPIIIAMQNYTRGTQVLQAASTDLLVGNFRKFRLYNTDYAIKPVGANGIIVASGMSGTVDIPKAYTFKAFKNGAALLPTDVFSTNDVLTIKVYDGTEEVDSSIIDSFTIEARHGGNDISSVFSEMVQSSTYSNAKIVIPSTLVDFADYIDAYICVTIAGSVYDYSLPIKISHEKVVSMAADNFEDLINSVITAGVRDLVITVNDVSNENFASLVSYIGRISNVYNTAVDTVQLKLEGTLTTIPEEAFFINRKLTSVVLPDSLRTIEKKAFSNCTNLVSLNLGNGVVTIGESAFSTCNIGYVRIPASVTRIDKNAFYYNSNVLGVKEVVFDHPTGWSDGTNSIDFTDSVAAANILRTSLNKTYTRN